MKMEARMVLQDDKIAGLQRENSDLWQENSDLWQEIHRLKGPRLPVEIQLHIVESAQEDKKALENFSLVCKSWMHITRATLFARISYSAMFWLVKVNPIPILNNPHCTVFPYVKVICFDGSMDDGSGYPAYQGIDWMDKFLIHLPKFSALTLLQLYSLAQSDLDAIDLALLPATKGHIRGLDISQTDGVTMPAMAAFVSKFTELTTLECGEMLGAWSEDALICLMDSDQPLVAPPSSITKLVFSESGHLPSVVLKWFTDLHAGVIQSLSPSDLPKTHPEEFNKFLEHFSQGISNITLSISGDTDQLIALQTLASLHQLKFVLLDAWGKNLGWLPSIITQLPPSIERITVSIDDSMEFMEELNYVHLDKTLVRVIPQSLHNFTFRIRNNSYHSQNQKNNMKETMLRLLPRLAKKHMFTIDFRV
ncbi:hypothetical protein C8F01DRAFT_1079103 [Mycena amicta]|nr:hypothetical protein C8F01DRAFT_1079103 [Mycena amicta]